MKKTKTADYAKRYQCTTRTIREWKRQGAPLEDPTKMRPWLAGRKNLPPNLPLASDDHDHLSDTTPQATGAASALARLERAEVQAYTKLQKAFAGGDALAIRTARDSWLKIADALRQFERAVSLDRRERGELVMRSEVETAIRLCAKFMRITWDSRLPQITDAVRAVENVIEAREILETAGLQSVIGGIAGGVACQIPPWIREAFAGDVQQLLRGDIFASAERIAEAIASIRESPPQPA